MLCSLYIKDFALIDTLEVRFNSGLNIITGETGAGKSILIGALKLILGERASTEVIRTGARKTVIEGIFDHASTPALQQLLEENAIETQGDILILRREVTPSYSRAFINDTPTTLPVMRAVAAHLIDLHGQHEHQSLLHPEKHLELLDKFGGLGGLRQTYLAHYRTVAELHRKRQELLQKQQELQRQKDLFEFQLQEIDRVAPMPEEETALEEEQRILEHAEHLYEATAQLYEMLYENEHAVYDQLVLARNTLLDLSRIDSAFESVLEEIRSAEIIVSEVTQFLQDYNARIEFNPERLELIRDRLNELHRLKRKYGGTLEDVLRYREEIATQYALATDFEGAIARLETQIQEAEKALTEAALRLSGKRREVAERIEQAIVAELATLGIPHTRFEVRFTAEADADGWIRLSDTTGEKRYRAFQTGMDQVEFYISTNVGEVLRPLSRTISGGESSRIMLALKSILARSDRLPILVFDEIDTGISGEIALRVGQTMRNLARYHQIIAITHLPQIAALGDTHFQVEKKVEQNRTRTTIRQLNEEERAEVVATLIGGSEITEATLASAWELMNNR